jgi:hypothetical protein
MPVKEIIEQTAKMQAKLVTKRLTLRCLIHDGLLDGELKESPTAKRRPGVTGIRDLFPSSRRGSNRPAGEWRSPAAGRLGGAPGRAGDSELLG